MVTEAPVLRLSTSLQDCARRYIAAQQRSGESLLDACAALSEARSMARHGEWGMFLEATRTSESTAKRLLDIHTAAEADPQYREAVRSNWIGATVAAEIAQPSFPVKARTSLLDSPSPPTKADVRAFKSATVADSDQPRTTKHVAQAAAEIAQPDLPPEFSVIQRRYETHGITLTHETQNGVLLFVRREKGGTPVATMDWQHVLDKLSLLEDGMDDAAPVQAPPPPPTPTPRPTSATVAAYDAQVRADEALLADVTRLLAQARQLISMVKVTQKHAADIELEVAYEQARAFSLAQRDRLTRFSPAAMVSQATFSQSLDHIDALLAR